MTKSIYQYSLRIWLTTLFASPPFVFIANYVRNSSSFWDIVRGLFLFEGYSIGFGLLVSVPSVLLFYFISIKTSKIPISIQVRKLILIVFVLALLLTTFSILLGGLNQLYNVESLRYIAAYSLVLIVSIIFNKLPAEITQQPT